MLLSAPGNGPTSADPFRAELGAAEQLSSDARVRRAQVFALIGHGSLLPVA